jgi:hypothetical protein
MADSFSNPPEIDNQPVSIEYDPRLFDNLEGSPHTDAPRDWEPYEELALESNGVPGHYKCNNTMDTNIIFSDSISEHSTNFTRALLQLSELDSNNEADGEEWEINPTEICLHCR